MPKTITDPTPVPPLPSPFSIASKSAPSAPGPTTTARNPETPTDINLPTNNAGDVDSVHTYPHLRHRPARSLANPSHRGWRTSACRIHHTRLHCPHRPRTFTHRMGPFYHMHILEDLRQTTTGCITPSHPPSINTTNATPSHINSPSSQAPNCHPPRKWEVCISTRFPRRFGCTGDLSPRLSRHVKRRGYEGC
nr:unnamed protein product [Spirometra erinaceieuropaei]